MVKAFCLTLLLPAMLLGGIPDLRRPVTDPDGILSASDREAVADRLVRLRSETGAQLAVLVVKTTGGVPIDDYAIRAVEAWKGGEKGRDNGALLVLAVKDRRMRLEVGYGLEEHLPDGAVRPLMRARDYRAALLAIIEGVGARLPGNVASTAEAPSGLPVAERDTLGGGTAGLPDTGRDTGGGSNAERAGLEQDAMGGADPAHEGSDREVQAGAAATRPEADPEAVVVPVPEPSFDGRNAFLGMVLSALVAVSFLAVAQGAWSERLGATLLTVLKGALFLVPPVVISLLSPESGGTIFLGYAGMFVALLVGVRSFQQGPGTAARSVGTILVGCLAVGIAVALVNADPARLPSFLDKTFLFGVLAMVPVALGVFAFTAMTAPPSDGDLFGSSTGVNDMRSTHEDFHARFHESVVASSSFSSSDSGSSSSSSSDSSSSSSDSSWGGGGGDFGGGGASSSWD